MTHVKIFQILNGIENHLITLELNENNVSGQDKEEALSELTKLIYENDKKVYFAEGRDGIVFYPQQGPVKFELV